MKRIFFAAMAAVALLAGCAKNEDAPETRKLNVVFSVADKTPYGADTKALKQGWGYADEILIVFEAESNDWLDPSGNDNTVLLVYDGEGWYVSNQDDKLVENLRTSSGWFYAVHYPGTIMLGSKDGEGKTSFQTYTGGEYLTTDGEWTLDGNNLILGEINMKRRSDMFQISVLDLATDPGNWTLSIFNDEGTSQGMEITHMNSSVGLYLMEDEVGIKTKTYDAATGVKIGDDVAFSFILDDAESFYQLDDVTFELNGPDESYTMILSNSTGYLLEGGKAYLMPGSYSTKWTKE